MVVVVVVVLVEEAASLSEPSVEVAAALAARSNSSMEMVEVGGDGQPMNSVVALVGQPFCILGCVIKLPPLPGSLALAVAFFRVAAAEPGLLGKTTLEDEAAVVLTSSIDVEVLSVASFKVLTLVFFTVSSAVIGSSVGLNPGGKNALMSTGFAFPRILETFLLGAAACGLNPFGSSAVGSSNLILGMNLLGFSVAELSGLYPGGNRALTSSNLTLLRILFRAGFADVDSDTSGGGV